MKRWPLLLSLPVGLLLLVWAIHQLSLTSVGLAASEESQAALEKSLADQKALARYDPAHAAAYRRRFEAIQGLLNHLQIVTLSRRGLTQRFEFVLIGIVGIVIAGGVAASAAAQRHRDRERVDSIRHLSLWQESARRHAHEIRTPLTSARMEVTSLVRWLRPQLPAQAGELERREQGILDELERLRRFTSNFVAFASIAAPALRPCDLGKLVADFCALFSPNWEHLTLRATTEVHVHAAADAAMIRQVLVNLCNNSALAVAERGSGVVTFSVGAKGNRAVIDVVDDGPGIAAEVRRRLFEPYVTTRRIGEGIGLGLAISRKIMLDHGGDLVLLGSTSGAAFRLTLPRMDA
jgi:signal transduction histidine kinase